MVLLKQFVKMQLLFATIAISFFYLNTPTTAAPTGSILFGDGALELNNIKIPEIADGVHEWFRGMRDRVFGTSATPPDLIAVIDSAKNSYEQQRKFLDSFLVDMSNVTFSPEDWGFRLGRWYVIKKDSEDWMSTIWNIFHPRLPDGSTPDDDWLEFDFDNEKNPVVPSFTTIIPVMSPEEKPAETTEVMTIQDNETRDQ